MIIDCHGHYTTVPKKLHAWRERQLTEPGSPPTAASLRIGDDEIRLSIAEGQLKRLRERGSDMLLFSPIAGQMAHHLGTPAQSAAWAELNNDLIHRVCTLFPDAFAGVCQLPQSPDVSPANCVAELTRCITQLGFVGCNLNPDPSGGYWTDPPLSDRYWYPLYEAMVELDIPAMIHVSSSCNPCFHHTGAHYINGDTTAFMQFLTSRLFEDFPTLRFVIPHGGGAVPYHWGRYRGLAQDMGLAPLEELLLRNVFFDTCVYHQPGVNLLTTVVPVDNILFGSEMIGAVKGIDPRTGHYYDDTKRYIDAAPLADGDRSRICEMNVRSVYPRLKAAVGVRS